MGVSNEASESQRLTYIRQHLSEDVQLLVRSCKTMEAMWKTLDEEYSNPLEIMKEIIQDIANTPKCQENKPQSTVEFISEVELMVKDLEYSKMDSEMNFVLMITVLEIKFTD